MPNLLDLIQSAQPVWLRFIPPFAGTGFAAELFPNGTILQFDAVVSYGIDAPVTVTRFPVEPDPLNPQIAPIDHAVIEPKRIMLDVLQSDDPGGLLTQFAQIGNQLEAAFSGEPEARRTKSLLDQLILLRDNRTFVDLTTSLGLFNNYIITGLSPNRNAATMRALTIRIELTEIRLVESQIVTLPTGEAVSAASTTNRTTSQPANARNTAARGQQPAAADTRPAQSQSVLNSLFFN